MRSIFPKLHGARWGRLSAHVRAVCRSDSSDQVGRWHALAAALGAAVGIGLPILIAGIHQRLGLGLLIALGAVSAQREVVRIRFAQRLGHSLRAVSPAALAALCAALFSSNADWADLIIIVVASASGVLIRYSREIAVATVRFIIFLVIFGSAIVHSRSPFGAALLISLGALWTAIIILLATVLFSLNAKVKADSSPSAVRPPSVLKQLQRLRRECRHAAIWDYPMRLMIGLTAALAIRLAYPSHHYSWISISVALLTPRMFELWPLKATQRCIGTLLGVGAAGAMSLWGLHGVLLATVITVLAALRSWFEVRNYLVYTAVMAPLVLFLMGTGGENPAELLRDRVVATLVGVLLVLLANLVAILTTAQPWHKPGVNSDRS